MTKTIKVRLTKKSFYGYGMKTYVKGDIFEIPESEFNAGFMEKVEAPPPKKEEKPVEEAPPTEPVEEETVAEEIPVETPVEEPAETEEPVEAPAVKKPRKK